MLTLLSQAIVVDAFLYAQLQQATKEIAFPQVATAAPARARSLLCIKEKKADNDAATAWSSLRSEGGG